MAAEENQLEKDASVLRFYKIVLSWDYLRILNEYITKDKGKYQGLRKVKVAYKDVDDYLSTFEPLLFEEVKAQILIGKSEEEAEGDFLAVVVKCTEGSEFHVTTVVYDGPKLSQNDLILISRTKLGEGRDLPTDYAFALVEHCHSDGEQADLRMYLKGEVKHLHGDGLEPCPRLLNMCSVITEVQRSTQPVSVYIKKICSLSTITREYVALRSISSLPFKDLILAASDGNYNSEDRTRELPRALMESIESNYNQSQMDSIRVGLSGKRFVLIQGPPGTGKTQTILGLLTAVLHATPARLISKGGPHGVKWGPELPIQESPEVISSARKHRVRVLVCAPSNSALDEIVLRLLNTGIRDENDCRYNPKFVRIGSKLHHSVQKVFMDYLVEQRQVSVDFMGSESKQGHGGSDKDSLRASILEEAEIVFSTLNYSGLPLLSKLNRGFDVVIIDEAAQAVEPATLIPLAYGCKQVFLVGDPVQLPAAVISPVAQEFGYGTSLFTRFQKAGHQVVMLKTQYRMHPEIRSFPSSEFYGDELEDGSDVKDQTTRAWHEYSCFGPFCFFDIHQGKESQSTAKIGYYNEDEVDFVLAMYHKLVSKYPVLKESSRFAIITPYQEQVKLFRQRFRSRFGVESDNIVDINTVDGFQGREKDVAIFSCVRSNEKKRIGFVSDFRRMNVGLTRARSSVLVVGSSSTLESDRRWKSLRDSAETKESLYTVSKPYENFFSDENLRTMIKPEMPEVM